MKNSTLEDVCNIPAPANLQQLKHVHALKQMFVNTKTGKTAI